MVVVAHSSDAPRCELLWREGRLHELNEEMKRTRAVSKVWCKRLGAKRCGARKARAQYVRSAASPAPMPDFFVGVFTETKMMSHSRMAASISVEKKRLRPRAVSTTSCRPGS